MKIEKISEDKIRIILKQDDFRDKSINVQKLLLTSPDSQKLFLELLNKVKEKFDFNIDGHKLLIESYFEDRDNYILTITRYSEIKKHMKIKPGTIPDINSSSIYKFSNFDDFCALCNFLNKNNNIENAYKTAVLYYYNRNYYLIIKNKNLESNYAYILNSYISEFSKATEFSTNFELKLKEYGKVILKNNAIKTGITYLSYK